LNEFQFRGADNLKRFCRRLRRAQHRQENFVPYQSSQSGENPQVDLIVRRANQKENIRPMPRGVAKGDRLMRDSEGYEGIGEDRCLRAAGVKQSHAIF
jgi:hypothetical protein